MFQTLFAGLRHFVDSSLVRGFAVGGFLLAFSYGLYRRWVGGNMCTSKAVLPWKTAIITGANSGIGLETAVELARRGARVILACRSEEKGERAAKDVRMRSGNQNVVFVQLDLASLSSIHAFVKKILLEETRLHILVNNAGVALASYKRTADGFEMHMGVNYLGHFLLTNLLLDRMKVTPGQSRVIFVASALYKRSLEFEFANMNSDDPSRYNKVMPGRAYSQSKLANILFSRSLSKRLEGSGVSTYALCPGMVRTELARDFYKTYNLPRTVSEVRKCIYHIT